LKRSLGKYVSIGIYDAAAKHAWHRRGGFPVDPELHGRLGEPYFPKNPYDIRGEIIAVELSGKRIDVAIDHSDYSAISSEVLDQVTLMFKSSVAPDERRSNIVPSVLLSNNAQVLAAARFLQLRSPRTTKGGADVYGRFGSWTDAQSFREQIVDRLQKSSLNFNVGFDHFKPYAPYLQDIRRAQLCVEVPGQGPVSYRLMEGMALGIPVVAAKPKVQFPTELIENTHYLRIRDDASDVVEVCETALRNPELRAAIAQSAAHYFDLNLSIEAAARRILRSLDRYMTSGPE
jgi:hypothetical protein